MIDVSALDIFLRQQIFIEQYKNGQDEQSSQILDEIVAIIIFLLLKRGYETFADMPKYELNIFLTDLNKRLGTKLGVFERFNMSQLRQFFNVSYSMNSGIFRLLGGKKLTAPKAGSQWTKFINMPAPGIGDEPRAVFRTLSRYMLNSVVKTVKQSYADKLSIAETAKLITGTRANAFKDGLVNKFTNQIATTVRTFTQNIISFVNYQLGALFFEKYQWVSVLDSKTTAICRSRDGNIYVYGKGPRPPAHYSCRSNIVPVMVPDDMKDMPTFFNWAKGQPVAIQNEIFGKRDAAAFRAGKMSADDVGTFRTNKKLTLEEFKGKRNLILTPNEKSA